MFLLSPSKTYVEETDKFGVQLVSMRPNLEEDRRFCFELKLFSSRVTTTGSSGGNGGGGATGQYISVVLQAESLKELKSWFNAIELTKKYVASLDKNSLEYDTSFRNFLVLFVRLQHNNFCGPKSCHIRLAFQISVERTELHLFRVREYFLWKGEVVRVFYG